jgi:hypothetical protein
VDLTVVARYYELSSIAFPDPWTFTLNGRCCQTGRGAPIDSRLAAELFQRAADFGHRAGANADRCCLEMGDGIDKNIERAVRSYQKAARQSNQDGLYNIGRCLEYGIGIPRDLTQSMKYYRLSAPLKDPMAEHSFRICLERGIGIDSNLALAASFYRRSAAHGDPEGANNFGFCLEHGRGVKQNIEAAAKCYRFARDDGHAEGEVNYRRCLRILDRWEAPDRSYTISDRFSSDGGCNDLFIACLDNPGTIYGASEELLASIHRLKSAIIEPADRLIVTLAEDFGPTTAVPRAVMPAQLNHPLILSPCTDSFTQHPLNGSLANQLLHRQIRKGTRIARTVTGITLAIRYLHSQRVIHCNLSRHSVLLDWDWNARLVDIRHSIRSNSHSVGADLCASVRWRYLAPECFENEVALQSNVFAFGLILYEIVIEKAKPKIPDFVLPGVAGLICHCWAFSRDDRPLFHEIFDRWAAMQFRVTTGVNSATISAFVKKIMDLERDYGVADTGN